MKQKPRHQKTARQQAAKLLLTPSLAQNAQTVVSIFDRVDWQQVNQTKCDTVHLNFQSGESLPAAHHIWLEMAAGALGQRTAIIGKIKQAFKKIGFSSDRGKIGEKVPDQLTAKSVNELLENLAANQDPHYFAELCVQASLLHHHLDAETRRIPRSPAKKAAGKTLLPPLAVDPPCWLGPAADLWMSVPLRLALTEPIVGLCRRITEINTGENTLLLKPAEEQAIQQHRRFFIECRPQSYRIPSDDPFGGELQGILDAFVPALRAVINDWSSEGNATGLTSVAKAPAAPAATEAQPRTAERTQPGSGEKAVKIKDAAKMLGVCENTVRRLIIRNKGNAEIVEYLLSAGARLSYGAQIADAADEDSLETLLLLLEKGYELSPYAKEVVASAGKSASPRVLKYVLERETVHPLTLIGALENSVRKASDKCVDILIEHGAVASWNQSLCLKIAVDSREFGIARKLIYAGAMVSDLNPTAVVYAIESEDWEFLVVLLRYGIPTMPAALHLSYALKFFRHITAKQLLRDGVGDKFRESIIQDRQIFVKNIGAIAANNSSDDAIAVGLWITGFLLEMNSIP